MFPFHFTKSQLGDSRTRASLRAAHPGSPLLNAPEVSLFPAWGSVKVSNQVVVGEARPSALLTRSALEGALSAQSRVGGMPPAGNSAGPRDCSQGAFKALRQLPRW